VRFFLISDTFDELPDWPDKLPDKGFLWVTSGRREFEVHLASVQERLLALAGGGLVDPHVSDLLNPQLPSQYDYTSWYDILVFRRLAAAQGTERMFLDDAQGTASSARQALAAIDTSPVGLAVFDKVLLTVHPADCTVRDFFEARLNQIGGTEARTDGRGGQTRLPPSPADLMVRIVNHMVDSYLDRLPERLVHLGKGRIQGLLPDQDRSLVVVQLVIELGQGPLPVPGYTVKDGPDALRNGTFGLFAFDRRGCFKIDHGRLL